MRYRVLIAFATILGSCVVAFPYARDALMQFARDAQYSFDTLPLGITLDEATARLRSAPIGDASESCLPQRQGFESDFARAENSDAVHFYLFRNGTNWYYCLGFDSDGKLVFTGEGCS